jgi:hypothetical protein
MIAPIQFGTVVSIASNDNNLTYIMTSHTQAQSAIDQALAFHLSNPY